MNGTVSPGQMVKHVQLFIVQMDYCMDATPPNILYPDITLT